MIFQVLMNVSIYFVILNYILAIKTLSTQAYMYRAMASMQAGIQRMFCVRCKKISPSHTINEYGQCKECQRKCLQEYSQRQRRGDTKNLGDDYCKLARAGLVSFV